MVSMRILTRAPSSQKKRFPFLFLLLLAIVAGLLIEQPYTPIEQAPSTPTEQPVTQKVSEEYGAATIGLEALAVKGRAPKTGYSREQFGDGWQNTGACDMRNRILARDLENVVFEEGSCVVVSGRLQDPYTGKTILFQRGRGSSALVQIDHVVALSDAWQKGAQQLTPDLRIEFANDGLNLLAVDGSANQNKGDGDAATWLPANKSIRCSYIARQISVKLRYSLWVTAAEKAAMKRVLEKCPDQVLPD